MPALMNSVMIYLTGKLVGDPFLGETQRGKPMCRLLLEIDLAREIGRGELQIETHRLPVVMYSRVANEARDLRRGDSVTVVARLNGTKFEKPGEETKHGLQLIGETLLFASPVLAKETL
jgi:single-stranded DNA-binding protein